MQPVFSVVVPAYNEEAFILALLRSLERQDLDAGSFEVIVVDNGSTDGTCAMVESFRRDTALRVVLMREARPGVCAARNAGGHAARGDTLVFLDADNTVPADFLRAILERRTAGFEAGTTMTLADGHSPRGQALFLVMELLKVVVGRPFGKCFCARELFLEIGGFDESVAPGDNLDFLVRLKRLLASRGARLGHVPRPVFASLRRFEDRGYADIAARWLLAYLGIRRISYWKRG